MCDGVNNITQYEACCMQFKRRWPAAEPSAPISAIGFVHGEDGHLILSRPSLAFYAKKISDADEQIERDDNATRHSSRKYTRCNYFVFFVQFVAIVAHLGLAIRSGIFASTQPRIMLLKEDRAYLVPALFANGSAGKHEVVPVADFVQIISPWTGSNSSSVEDPSTISETCGAAKPVALEFMRGDNFVANMWTYPADSGRAVDVGWCLCGFFAMSCAFQLLEISTGVMEMKDTEPPHATNFNWLRFIEYSASGSLVLFAIALLCGITDLELLVCIFFLSWVCMIAGLVGEVCLRASADPSLERNHWRSWLLLAFWIAHAAGLLCITIAWWVVWRHYVLWFRVCDTPSLRVPEAFMQRISTADGGNNPMHIMDQIKVVLGIYEYEDGKPLKKRPPEWITGVVVAEFVLFLVFGFVQFMQGLYVTCGWKPLTNRFVELCYVVLSATAKVLLGILVFINLY